MEAANRPRRPQQGKTGQRCESEARIGVLSFPIPTLTPLCPVFTFCRQVRQTVFLRYLATRRTLELSKQSPELDDGPYPLRDPEVYISQGTLQTLSDRRAELAKLLYGQNPQAAMAAGAKPSSPKRTAINSTADRPPPMTLGVLQPLFPPSDPNLRVSAAELNRVLLSDYEGNGSRAMATRDEEKDKEEGGRRGSLPAPTPFMLKVGPSKRSPGRRPARLAQASQPGGDGPDTSRAAPPLLPGVRSITSFRSVHAPSLFVLLPPLSIQFLI